MPKSKKGHLIGKHNWSFWIEKSNKCITMYYSFLSEFAHLKWQQKEFEWLLTPNVLLSSVDSSAKTWTLQFVESVEQETVSLPYQRTKDICRLNAFFIFVIKFAVNVPTQIIPFRLMICLWHKYKNSES